jgi:predicted house-cleaning NTP pyrophosphatase (Maf/HAM1 superfamily)
MRKIIYDDNTDTQMAEQLREAVEALRKLAEIHHDTLTPSKLHDPHNRNWTECECRSCRLAQPFA